MCVSHVTVTVHLSQTVWFSTWFLELLKALGDTDPQTLEQRSGMFLLSSESTGLDDGCWVVELGAGL